MNLEVNGDGILFLMEKKVKITIMSTIKTVSVHSKVSERISLKKQKISIVSETDTGFVVYKNVFFEFKKSNSSQSNKSEFGWNT